MATRPNPQVPEADRVLKHLHEILASEEFAGSPKLSRFLEFTVEQTLGGRGDTLKEYLLGVEIYGRPTDYDPRTDPIIRVEARRLRTKLKRFYEFRTTRSDVEFEYPKGSYVPEFRFRDRSLNSAVLEVARPLKQAPMFIGSALAVLGLSVVLLNSRAHMTVSTREPLLTKITADQGLSAFPSLSPDGQQVAYASDRDTPGALHIWVQPVQPVSRGEAKRLTYEPATNIEPSFSADGTRIAYTSYRGAGSGIYIVPTNGGAERLLVPNGQWPRFSPDGKWLAYWVHRSASTSGRDELYILSVSGGTPRRLAPNFTSATLPNWSSDSKHLIFRGMSGGRQTLDWYALDLDRGSPTRTFAPGVMGKYHMIHALGWDYKPYSWVGDRVLFTARLGEITNVWQLRFSMTDFKPTGVAERLTFGTGFDQFPTMVEPAGRKSILAYADTIASINIWSLPVEPNTGKATLEPAPVTQELATWVEEPSVSADGAKMTHIFLRSSETNLTFIRDLRTGSLTKLDRYRLSYDSATVSPDGSRVAYCNPEPFPGQETSEESAPADPLYVTPANTTQAEADGRLLCADCGRPMSWSRDNRKLLFGTRRGTVSVFDIESRQASELFSDPTQDLEAARFSPSADWIAFCARDRSSSPGGRIYVATFDGSHNQVGQRWISVTDAAATDELAAWSPDGNLLYILSRRDGFRCIWAQRLDPHSKHPVGPPFSVRHFHGFRHSLQTILGRPEAVGLCVTRDQLFFSMDDLTGNVWIARW